MTEPDAFDQFASEYDQWFEDHDTEYQLELRAIRKFLPGGGDGIEIGAGTGRFTRPLGISLGVEPSAAMRSIALDRGVNVVAGKAESIPIKDCSYDFVLMVTTICFLQTPEIALQEAYRILGTDGLIIVGMIDKNSHLGERYEAEKGKSRFYQNASFHPVDGIMASLGKTGFTNIECIQVTLPGDTNEGDQPVIKQGYGEGSFVVLRARKA